MGEEEMIMDTMDSMDARASRLMEDAVSSYVARVEVERRLQRDVARLEEIGDERKEVEKEAELLRASLRQSMKRRRTSSTNPSTWDRNKLRESNDTSNTNNNYNMNGRKKNNNNDRKERPESGARPTSSSGGRRDRLPIIQQRKRGATITHLDANGEQQQQQQQQQQRPTSTESSRSRQSELSMDTTHDEIDEEDLDDY